VGQVGRPDPLGAIELTRQPHRAANQIKLEGIAGLLMAVMACWVRSSSSLGSSWGRTGMMVRAVMPCLKALRRTRAFPSSVFGPVLLCALRRLAWICAAVATV
jgi:hypothetical protein